MGAAIPAPTARTRLVALLGHPVAHSASPAMHNAAFAASGVDAVYLALDVAPADLAEAVRGLDVTGALGANVTVPHKETAFRLTPRRTAAATACGAANTLYRDDDGSFVADNTDVEGLEHVLRTDVTLRQGDPVVLFGAGGAARAAAVALGRLGAVVEVVARRASAAATVSQIAADHGATLGSDLDARVVVNATTLGLHGEALPDRFMALRPGQVALDLVYGTAQTPFVFAARRAGAGAFDGRGLLLQQAAAAFQRWTGAAAPVTVMSEALDRALERS